MRLQTTKIKGDGEKMCCVKIQKKSGRVGHFSINVQSEDKTKNRTCQVLKDVAL